MELHKEMMDEIKSMQVCRELNEIPQMKYQNEIPQMKYQIIVYTKGQDLTILAELLNDNWYIYQVNECDNTIVYILSKSILE